MMTTETDTRPAGRRATRSGNAGLLVRSAALTAVLAVLVAVVAALSSGAPAALGVLAGTSLGLVVLLGGSLLVDAVAGILPAASLLVAMLTFTLQLLVVLLAFVALEDSGVLGDQLSRDWLGGAVIAATMVWLAVQVRLQLTARTPVYDLSSAGMGTGPDVGRPDTGAR